ncbi:MAG: TetR/AcrR family transcriptional regulator [Pseudomonadota bacterium]
MPRGRPRKFDEDAALNGAMFVFWQKGLSATSLDDLVLAMGMNRPSIYNAFGNKDQVYRKALARFCGQLDIGVQETFETIPDLQEGLQAFFNRAIDVYCGTNPALGCLMVCTAPGEAFLHPQVGDDLKELIQRLDQSFARRLARARTEGKLSPGVNPKMAASLLQATLQTIALRARTGASKTALKKIAAYAIEKLV